MTETTPQAQSQPRVLAQREFDQRLLTACLAPLREEGDDKTPSLPHVAVLALTNLMEVVERVRRGGVTPQAEPSGSSLHQLVGLARRLLRRPAHEHEVWFRPLSATPPHDEHDPGLILAVRRLRALADHADHLTSEEREEARELEATARAAIERWRAAIEDLRRSARSGLGGSDGGR